MLRLVIANVKMMVRDRQTLFWALLFPLIFVVVFGLFDVDEQDPSSIAIVDQAQSGLSRAIHSQLADIQLLGITEDYTDEATARQAVQDGDLDYALVIPQDFAQVGQGPGDQPPVPFTLYYDQGTSRTNQLVFGVIRQFLDQVNLDLADAPQRINLTPEAIQDRDVNYFDELIIGLVGFAIMFNSVVVISVKISGYRQQSILRRFLVTPLPLRNYFAGEVVTHLALAMVQVAIILAVGTWAFGAEVHGNVLWVFVIAAFSTIVFLNIGFAIGGRANSPGAASGLANIVAMPMMFFSGTFFPTSSLPSFLPELVKILPLTPTIDALHIVAIEGEPLWNAWPELAMVAGWIILTSALAARFFRFN